MVEEVTGLHTVGTKLTSSFDVITHDCHGPLEKFLFLFAFVLSLDCHAEGCTHLCHIGTILFVSVSVPERHVSEVNLREDALLCWIVLSDLGRLGNLSLGSLDPC